MTLTQDSRYLVFSQKVCRDDISRCCFRILLKRLLRIDEFTIASKIDSSFTRALTFRASSSKLLGARSSKHLTIISSINRIIIRSSLAIFDQTL